MRIANYIAALLIFPLLLRAQKEDDSVKNWSGNIAAYYYYIPGEKVPPTITAYADYKALHFETRFNYEDINSVSLFAGHTYEKDKGDLSISVTPMFGVLVGRTDGVLPGLEFEIDKSIFKLYSENEYLLSFAGKHGDFFYSWSQLSTSTIKNLSLGLAAQTLRFYQTDFDIQKGFYGEYTTGKFLLDGYYFNPFSKFSFYSIAVNFNF